MRPIYCLKFFFMWFACLEDEELWSFKGLGLEQGTGTVGAVVLDDLGNLAAGQGHGLIN